MKKLFLICMALCSTFAIVAWINAQNKDVMKEKDVMKKEKVEIQKTRSLDFILDSSKDWEPAGEGVTRKIMGYDGQVMLVKVKFEKKAVGTPHRHYHTQTTYVASGKFEFDIEGKKQIVSAGDGIYIEPDALHGCVCLEEGLLIDCFSPMRDDFLK